MIKFDREQKIFDIAGVKVGGQPGECPTVLIGTIFYDGHKIVSDPVKGYFDRKDAESLIEKQEEMSRLTGNHHILDVFASTAEALCRYIDFIADVTEAPFLVDSMSSSERIPAIKHAIEIGLRERAIYNSIDYSVREEETSSLRELGVKSAVVLTYNPTNVWAEGRIEILKGTKTQKGLLKAAEESGIKNILVDTSVLDVPSISLASKAIQLVKNEFGLPAGCGPANAITTWKKVKKELGPYAYDVCMAAGAVITQLNGANFVLYGPIEFAERVFPACSLIDALNTYYGRRMGIKPQVSEHPLAKIL
jgi:tetrahydromethanopterin S-methyltransferase subunit H